MTSEPQDEADGIPDAILGPDVPPECEAVYDAPGEEFDLARALIEARAAAGLSQSQLAKKMKTSQSYIARIEGGKLRRSTDALERFAHATGTRLRIIFEPEAAR